MAEALHDLPALAQALRDGAISWSAVRELSRVAVAKNEHAWLQIAEGRTLRQIEELVSGHQLGDAPDGPTGVPSLTHVLRWKVSAEVFSTVREAIAKLRRVVLCSAHHRAQHRGQILIEGRVSTGLTFRHADGTRYGVVADPLVVEAHLQAFRALRALGFREGETRRALEQVRSDPRGAGNTRTEGVLRAALSILSAATRSVTSGPGAGAVAPSWIEPTESEASRGRGLAKRFSGARAGSGPLKSADTPQ